MIPWMDQVDIKTGEVLIKDDEYAVKFGEVCIKKVIKYGFK